MYNLGNPAVVNYPSSWPPAFFTRPTERASKSLRYLHRSADEIEGELRILPARHSRALQTGLELARQRPLVILGISPGNAFFTRKRIEVAICAMARLFGDVVVVVPDTIAVHTYRALGYDEKQSAAKAKENGLNIRNRCQRAIERARRETPTAELRLLDWERDVASLPGYDAAYERVCNLFDTNEPFRRDVLDKGRDVLAAKLGEAAVTDAAVAEGIKYLLKEFAYFTLFRDTFGRDVVIPYHQNFTLGQRFCDGSYQPALPGIGWLIYDIELPTDRQPRGAFYASAA